MNSPNISGSKTINNKDDKECNNLVLEITVLSAEGLKSNTSTNPFSYIFSQRLRPFVTVSTYPPTGADQTRRRKTVVDEEGGRNPTWGDRFCIPIDANFVSQRHSSIYLQLFSKRVVLSEVELGWCQIPMADVIDDGWSSAGPARHLSYRLRERDGSRGDGVVNVAVRFFGSLRYFPATDVGPTAVGFPAALVM